MQRKTGRAKSERRTARYQEILDVIRQRIADGTYPVNGALPSEAEFCREFDASRFTIREALRRLQAEGLVARKQGAGSTVIRRSTAGVFVQSYNSMDQLLQFARDSDYRRISVDEVVLDADLAARLGAEEGEVWTCQRGLRLSPDGQEALALIESYLPPVCTPLVPALADMKPPFYAFLEAETGRRVSDMVQEVQAGQMPDHVARAMQVAPGTSTLRILRRYETQDGTLIASFNWHLGGDRFIYRTRLKYAGAET